MSLPSLTRKACSAAGTPRRVLACDATCRAFAADPTGQVGLLFGCKTRVIE